MRSALVLALCLSGCAPGRAALELPAAAPGAVSSPVAPPAVEGSTVDAGAEEYLMGGFSFVDEHLAGLPLPGGAAPLAQDLGFLADQGITLLVSATEVPTDPEAARAAGLDLLHLPIPDMQAPTLRQQLAFVAAVQERVARGERAAVHCYAGLGRTGTLLATWMVAGGLDAGEAIETVRTLRPGSIETSGQEDAVFRFDERWP